MKHLRKQSHVVRDSADDYADWPEPQPLQRPLPPPPKYPTKALGVILWRAAKEIANTVKAPEAMVGQCVLAASSLAVQGLRDVEMDGRRHPSSNYFLTIAQSGERKSAVDRIALKPVEAHQRRLICRHKKKLEKYYRRLALYKVKQREASREGDPAHGPGHQPSSPTVPMLVCGEPSVEGLFRILGGHPSIGIFSDEGGRFIGGYAMSQEKAVRTAATLNSTWDGDSINHVRGTKDPLILTGRRVSLHLMMQPNIAEKLVSNPEMLEQGLLARCLASRPTSLVGRHGEYVPVNPGDLPGVQAYFTRLQELFKTPLPTKAGALDPQPLSLTKEARARWTTFYNWVEPQCAAGGCYAQIPSFAAKAGEHVLRVAAVLATVDDPVCKCIQFKVMDNAIKIVKYHLKEARRLYGFGALDRQLELAEKTLQWLQNRRKKKFPLKFIYQKGPGQVRSAATARSIIKILVDHGWARRLDSEEEHGDSGKEVYIVRKK